MDVDELPIVSTVIIVGNFLHVKLYFHSIVIAGPLITYVWWSICPCFVLHTHFYSSLLWPLTHAHAHNLISAPDSSPNEGTVAPLLIDILDGYGNKVKQSFSWSNRFFYEFSPWGTCHWVLILYRSSTDKSGRDEGEAWVQLQPVFWVKKRTLPLPGLNAF